MNKAVIELQNIKRNFQVGDETVHALHGVSFTIREGEFVTIMGTSGSGKSTLLNTLGCLDTPTRSANSCWERSFAALADFSLRFFIDFYASSLLLQIHFTKITRNRTRNIAPHKRFIQRKVNIPFTISSPAFICLSPSKRLKTPINTKAIRTFLGFSFKEK